MPFGLARGLDFESFCKCVKTMQLVIIDGKTVEKIDIPLTFYRMSMAQLAQVI